MSARTNTTPRFRFLTPAALAAMSVLYATGVNASPRVLENANATPAASVPARAVAHSGVVGRLGATALSASSLELRLPDGQTVTARLQRIARDEAKAVQSWIGTFDDAPGSVLVLSKAKGVVTGYANYKEQVLELLPAAAGQHVLFAVDTARLPQTDEVTVSVTGEDALATTVDYGTGGTTSTTTSTSGVVHDVLVLYTGKSASTWGQATLESMIHSAVQSANQAYQNSRVSLTLNVVGLQKSPVSESGSGMSATLKNLKQNSTVRSLRDKLAADMVILVSEDGGSCGTSSLTITTLNGVTNVDAYALSASNCLSSHTLAHELGHLQRLDHNRENKTGIAAYAYSYGYRRCVTGGFRDVMSYPCSGVPRVLHFSNPGVYYNGYPTGISYESSPSSSAENARTLSNTATTVAAYRVGGSTSIKTTVPSAPSGMTVTGATYDYVSLAWTDNSTDEAGFTLQRSTDGVIFSTIASLGAGTRSYKDTSVSAKTRYYYRASAYNSAGASSYSNVASVTTPDNTSSIPATPSSISAVNKGDGSALVSWTDSSTNETGFELYRRKWNATSSTWSTWTKAVTVSQGTTLYRDYAGKGKYRYRVRAINSSGASKYAGPVSVSITGG